MKTREIFSILPPGGSWRLYINESGYCGLTGAAAYDRKVALEILCNTVPPGPGAYFKILRDDGTVIVDCEWSNLNSIVFRTSGSATSFLSNLMVSWICAPSVLGCGTATAPQTSTNAVTVPAAVLQNPQEQKCECGAAKVGIKSFSPGHSIWCPVK
jgi:hypothetical protein